MKTLYQLSWIPLAVHLAFVGLYLGCLALGLDLSEPLYPLHRAIWIAVTVLTLGYVALCVVVLLRTTEARSTKIVWIVVLVFGNMIAVPWFLRCYLRNGLGDAVSGEKAMQTDEGSSTGVAV
jgi:hypothetical protein